MQREYSECASPAHTGQPGTSVSRPISTHRSREDSAERRLLGGARSARYAHEAFRTHGQEERTILLQFILQGSPLQDGQIVPTFKPSFGIVRGLAQDAQTADRQGTKEQAASLETTCLLRLSQLDEFRTYCYETEIGSIPERLRLQ